MLFRSRMIAGLTACWAATSMSHAQSPAPRKVYTNKNSFNVPLRVDDSDRAVLKEIRFYVKPPNGAWMLQERGTPLTSRFSYQAAIDGEYAFSFTTVDTAGREAPASPDREPPRLVVVVDTQLPQFNAVPLTVASGQTYIQCTIRDANPEPSSLTAEYQGPDGWHSLELLDRELPGMFRTPVTGFPSTVKVTGKDKAGNVHSQVINLNSGQAPGPIVAAPAPPVVPTPAPPSPLAAPMPAPVPVPPEPRLVEKPITPESVITRPNVQLLNQRRCVLSYAFEGISPDQVQRVEVFVTRDDGRTWQNLGEDLDRRSPAEVMLPDDGLYGFVVLVSTARQPAAPPAAGEPADWWVELDTAPPEVKFESIQLGVGDEVGLVSLKWSVRDKNLKPDAVELAWSSSPEGPWQPIAQNLRAEGQYRWPVPREAGGRAYFKLEAQDQAGNVGRFVTPQPVGLETPKPRAKVLGINPAAVR
jgi:hypothetical protein